MLSQERLSFGQGYRLFARIRNSIREPFAMERVNGTFLWMPRERDPGALFGLLRVPVEPSKPELRLLALGSGAEPH